MAGNWKKQSIDQMSVLTNMDQTFNQSVRWGDTIFLDTGEWVIKWHDRGLHWYNSYSFPHMRKDLIPHAKIDGM